MKCSWLLMSSDRLACVLTRLSNIQYQCSCSYMMYSKCHWWTTFSIPPEQYDEELLWFANRTLSILGEPQNTADEVFSNCYKFVFSEEHNHTQSATLILSGYCSSIHWKYFLPVKLVFVVKVSLLDIFTWLMWGSHYRINGHV
jgi:hypothetical protein